MTPDRVFAIFEFILAVALLLSLSLFLMPAKRAQRIVRFIAKLFFGGRK